MAEINCACCQFRSAQNCLHPLATPMTFIDDAEPVVNHRWLAYDMNEYHFFRHLLFGVDHVHYHVSMRLSESRVFFANQILRLPDYYMYPIEYQCGVHGFRRITVGIIDRANKHYAQCEYDFDIFPHKLHRYCYEYKPRVTFLIRNFTHIHYGKTIARAHVTREFILHKGDWIVQKLITAGVTCETTREQLYKETGVLVSRRLVQLLTHANKLKNRIRAHLLNNCRCGGIAKSEECICVRMCDNARQIYDERQMVTL